MLIMRGGHLWQVTGYAAYTQYNAAGQVGKITYGNNTATWHSYDPNTLRLASIRTTETPVAGYNYTVTPEQFNWVTASNLTGLTGKDQYASFELPFPFTFYGNEYTSFYISSNVFLSLGSGSTDYSPDPIPHTNPPNNLVAGLWRDLNPAAGGSTSACITYTSSPNQFVKRGQVLKYEFQFCFRNSTYLFHWIFREMEKPSTVLLHRDLHLL